MEVRCFPRVSVCVCGTLCIPIALRVSVCGCYLGLPMSISDVLECVYLCVSVCMVLSVLCTHTNHPSPVQVPGVPE